MNKKSYVEQVLKGKTVKQGRATKVSHRRKAK